MIKDRYGIFAIWCRIIRRINGSFMLVLASKDFRRRFKGIGKALVNRRISRKGSSFLISGINLKGTDSEISIGILGFLNKFFDLKTLGLALSELGHADVVVDVKSQGITCPLRRYDIISEFEFHVV